MRITLTQAVVGSLTAVFLLLAADKSGSLRTDRYVWTPSAKPTAVAAPASPAADPDKGKPPPHHDKIEDLPEGKGREVTFYTCAACHGVALIKAQGMSRELWESSFELMITRHRMPAVKPEERAEILDYLAAQFPPRRPTRGRGADNPFR
jgi:mono/diheme cytochrome c family protein